MLVRGDRTLCIGISRKEQRVSTGVPKHDAQETAARFGGFPVKNAISVNYAMSSSLVLKLHYPQEKGKPARTISVVRLR